MSETKNIIVIGSSYSGVESAHLILNSIIPSLPNPSSYKVTLLSPSKYLFFNLATPRAILGLPADKGNSTPFADQVFGDIEAGFTKKHGSGTSGKVKWEIIEAFARRVDPEAQTLQFERVVGKEASIGFVGGDESKWESIKYDQLVVGTGTRPQPVTPVSAIHKNLPPPPFKGHGTASQTKSALQQWATAIKDSKTILLGGAGPTGVETSGEIADAYPDKKIILVSSDSEVLPRLLDRVGKTAHQMLEESGVEVRTGVKVRDAQVGDQSVTVTLSTGEAIDVDLYIPTHHAFIPSTEFLPSSIKDPSGFLLMSDHLNNPKYENIWGVGDVTAFPNNKNATNIDKQLFIMAVNLKSSLLRAAGQGGKAKPFQTYEHNESAPAFVPVGRKKGTGQFGSWKVWSPIVVFFKGKDMMLGAMQGLLNGETTLSRTKLALK